MSRPDRLVPCPSCACHIQASETRCPLCDAVVRAADGTIQRTAAALLLGLTAAVAGCQGPETAQPVYGTSITGGTGGVTQTGGAGGTTQTGGAGGVTQTGGTGGATGGAGGTGGMTGGGGAGGTGGDTSQPVYGAPPMK